MPLNTKLLIVKISFENVKITLMLIPGFDFVKACVRCFHQISIFSPNDSPSKTIKLLFIWSKKLFLFSRYSNFCISIFPSFFPVSHYFRGWSKINLKVYDVINFLNKNSITHFVWHLEKEKTYDIETLSIDGVSHKEHFYRKIMQKMCSKS